MNGLTILNTREGLVIKMHHVAIMRESWGLTQKVLSGEKKIESRWYKTKRAPWDNISAGDVVFFKEGKYVSVKADVESVLQFSLTPEKVREILDKYGADVGIHNIPEDLEFLKDKKYCILVFLKNPQKVEPFEIDKKGFGLMSAWLTVENVTSLRK